MSHYAKRLVILLVFLTCLFIIAQVLFFLIHYQMTDMVDLLAKNSIASQLVNPAILLPIGWFIFMQLLAYALFLLWVIFTAMSVGEWLNLSPKQIYFFGIAYWCASIALLLMLNAHYYPLSFFAKCFPNTSFLNNASCLKMLIIFHVWLSAAAFCHSFYVRRHVACGMLLLFVICNVIGASLYEQFLQKPTILRNSKAPNIIFIGLDSVRPDFTHFGGNTALRTPNIDAFLSSSINFTKNYTPLARTFPAWVSILTAQYPKHHGARNNLGSFFVKDTLASRLRLAGYETIYATDEKRFSNITPNFGFDRIIGPAMGVNDFLIGGLGDFPLTNLLVNLPQGRWLFPFNYANRAAAITYQPSRFLQLIKLGLTKRKQKPLFLAVHLCLSHWPFTWAGTQKEPMFPYYRQYAKSIEAVDKQFGELLNLLREYGLLENSLVVLLSDHGTALGLSGDRIIAEKNYAGDKAKLKWVPVIRNVNDQITIDSDYGQGNNVLSLKQYQTLLAFKRYKKALPAQQHAQPTSLLDIAPTILDFLKLPPLLQGDGRSLYHYFSTRSKKPALNRVIFMETGDSLSEIETEHIHPQEVIKKRIGIYYIDPSTTQLKMKVAAENSIIRNKQLAVLDGDWLLARFPAKLQNTLSFNAQGQGHMVTQYRHPYFIIANIKTGRWSVGLGSAFSRSAPTSKLLDKLQSFYGDEI